jgi:DNA-3-methyladenine glycosylase
MKDGPRTKASSGSAASPHSHGQPVLAREFYATESTYLARRLLGQRLVRLLDDGTRLSGLIVETEAYIGPEDRASHAFGGRRTARNESMYARPGTAYVYFTYGMHYCVNVVCARAGVPEAVLIRALEPEEGLEVMAENRGARRRPARPWSPEDLCSGPGKLCQALAIDRALDGADLVRGESLWVERTRQRPLPRSCLGNSPRIGIGFAGPWAARPLRWFIERCPHVSGKRNPGAKPRRRSSAGEK